MEKERIGQRLFKRWVVWAPVPRVSVTSETWFLAPIKLVPVCYNTVNYPELSDATVGTHLLTRASWSFKMVFFEQYYCSFFVVSVYHWKKTLFSVFCQHVISCFLWLGQHLPLLIFYPSYREAPSFLVVSVAVWRLMLPLLSVLVTGLNIGSGALKTTPTNKITSEASFSSSERSPLSR